MNYPDKTLGSIVNDITCMIKKENLHPSNYSISIPTNNGAELIDMSDTKKINDYVNGFRNKRFKKLQRVDDDNNGTTFIVM